MIDLEKLTPLTFISTGPRAQAALLAIAFRALTIQGLIDQDRATSDVQKILEPLIGEGLTEGEREAARRVITSAIAVIRGEV